MKKGKNFSMALLSVTFESSDALFVSKVALKEKGFV